MQQVRQGLKENWRQFALLVLVNALVGGMIGVERSIFPQFAAEVFGLTAYSAVLSFIIAFGFSKAATNYFTGRLANRLGRRNLLMAGWVIALPVPMILLHTTHWEYVIFANILLGVNQGLTWSSTVVMKIDLVGAKNRGLAMGLNEFAGYLSVGVVAFFTGWLAQHYGVRPYPFYMAEGIAVAGLLLTLLWVRDTGIFIRQESAPTPPQQAPGNVFMETTFRNKTLSAVTQAGMVNNLNDGMIWGLLPVYLASLQYGQADIGLLAAVYPTIWGIGQLFTGKMADIFSQKRMLFWGMSGQAIAIMALPFTGGFGTLSVIGALLGIGTALVYPTFLTAIAGASAPARRAEAVGIFRLWRDAGYAVGAIISGIIADWAGIQRAILLIGVLTLISALVIQWRMPAMRQNEVKKTSFLPFGGNRAYCLPKEAKTMS